MRRTNKVYRYWESGIPRIIGKIKAAGLWVMESIVGEELAYSNYQGKDDANNAK